MTFNYSGADKMPPNYEYQSRAKTSMKKTKKLKKLSFYFKGLKLMTLMCTKKGNVHIKSR